ncbi:D-2-hydroxyacid dehydrogenase [Tistrella bauzanensis]|uniref:D-2-hydroxyacid dehydrogenase n=1 Tax=Tistrella bauzanensis TaxID=657419 RepID=A0ABQ1IEV3_9PROT|nr:FAD-binding oxidoreductase [Tistrella bauzanensis]GGB35885.1 D-2-hydroxyacid dehydrogenase [Tistrella bauzanensis]
MPAAAAALSPSAFIDLLVAITGPRGVITAEGDMAPYLEDWRKLYRGHALAVVRPASTDEVAAIVRLCAGAGVAVVPQGGNTGLVGGAVPDGDARSILLQLGRMNRVRSIDPIDYSMVVEAGCVLEAVQGAARDAGRKFPLSLGAEGTAQIGGLIATNAGGIHVMRYGMMRDLVLGLEVVLPDGSVLSELTTLRKNNVGYDLKQLFIGAEGTLGIVTAASLKLFPPLRATRTIFFALPSLADGPRLLSLCREFTGDAVESFELIPRQGIDFATAHVPGTVDPLEGRPEWTVLTDISGRSDERLQEDLDHLVEAAFQAGLVTDGTIAQSEAQSKALWLLREAIVEGQRLAPGIQIKHDVSVQVSDMPGFVHAASEAVWRIHPDALINPFGHLGDGNIHFNVTLPAGSPPDAVKGVSEIVYRIIDDFGGSISAEHGIGRLKAVAYAARCPKPRADLAARLRKAVDPKGIMNPSVFRPAR